MSQKKSEWKPVTDLMEGGREVALGSHRSSWFKGSWRRALCFLAYYKFAAKMIGREKRVLDIGCGDGLGTWILAKECGFAKGIDQDRTAITLAQKSWSDQKTDFECTGLLRSHPEPWNALVQLNVEGRFLTTERASFFSAIKRNLSHDGIAILGISDAPGLQDVRARSNRFEKEIRRHFRHVFMFSSCDEMIHAGDLPAADHLIAVGCRKK